MCQFDLLGFPDRDRSQRVHRLRLAAGGGRALDGGRLTAFDRTVRTGVYPIGVHVDEVRHEAEAPAQSASRVAAARQPARAAADPERRSAGLFQGPAATVYRVRAVPRAVSAAPEQRRVHADRAAIARRHRDVSRDTPRAGSRGRPHQRTLRRSGLDATALSEPRLRAQRADAALCRGTGGAGDAAARRDEPGSEGVCRGAGSRTIRGFWCCRSSPARRANWMRR